ncbi:MAG: zinc ribbon domain-containing protein [Planctomycetota bacterium]
MPVYEYACKCGHRFEKLAKSMSSRDKADCPKCDVKAERVLSVMSVGSGEKEAEPQLPTCGTCGIPGGPCAMN